MISFALATAVPPAAAQSSSPNHQPVIVRIGWDVEPDTLNPFTSVEEYELFHLNYDYLVGFDPKTLQPRPEFAESWTRSSDGLTWTFNIRKGMTWQDGVPATARDVVFTYDSIIKYNLTMYTAYTNGITSIRAIGNYTVQMHTATPKANMLSSDIPIVPEHIWSKVSGKAMGSNYPNNPPVIGSGPYQIVKWKSDDYVELVANPHYWRGRPKIDELLFEYYTNPDTMAMDLKSETIDAALDVPRAQFSKLSSSPGITCLAADSIDWGFLAFNCYQSPNSKGNPVLRDESFRQALEWAVNRQQAIQLAADGYATMGYSVITPSLSYHWVPTAAQAYTYDPAKANEMLTAAGYKMGSNGYRTTKQGKPLTLRLYVSTAFPDGVTLGKLVVGWFKNVGVRVTMTVMDEGTAVSAAMNAPGGKFEPDYDMWIDFWLLEPDTTNQFATYSTQNFDVVNITCWTEPSFTRLFNQFETSFDPATRRQLSYEMQQAIYVASPFIIFYYPDQLEAYNTAKWSGWTHVGSNRGPVLYAFYNVDTYLNLRPATTSESTGSSKNRLDRRHRRACSARGCGSFG